MFNAKNIFKIAIIGIADKKIYWLLFARVFLVLISVLLVVLSNIMWIHFFDAMIAKNLDNIARALFVWTNYFIIMAICEAEGSFIENIIIARMREKLYNFYSQYNIINSKCEVVCQRLSYDMLQFSQFLVQFFFKGLLLLLQAPVFIYMIFAVGGYSIAISALFYAIVGTWLIRRVAKPIIKLDYKLENAEGLLRKNLVNNIANNIRKVPNINDVTEKFLSMCNAKRNVAYFDRVYLRVGMLIPWALLIPMFMKNQITFGTVKQSVAAFDHMMESFSFFVHQRENIVIIIASANRIVEIES
jgi:ABC-type uncharacterized transport system fused permease/ATPase subunit